MYWHFGDIIPAGHTCLYAIPFQSYNHDIIFYLFPYYMDLLPFSFIIQESFESLLIFKKEKIVCSLLL